VVERSKLRGKGFNNPRLWEETRMIGICLLAEGHYSHRTNATGSRPSEICQSALRYIRYDHEAAGDSQGCRDRDGP
jgi:hypothetical protein